jgi:hypothetical protein
MKKMFYRLSLLLMLALSAVAAAAPNFNGSWKGDVPRINGRIIPAVFDFVISGSALTGTVHAVDTAFNIGEGKVKGNEISFIVEGTQGQYTGKLNGDVINMKVKYDGGEAGPKIMEFVAKRVK